MKSKILIVLFLMSIVLFNSGCIGEDLTADQVAEEMQEKQTNIEDTPDDLLPVEMTFEEAQRISAFRVRFPSYLPEGFEPVSVVFSNGSGKYDLRGSFKLFYSGDEGSVVISENFYEGEQKMTLFPSDMEGEMISVNGVEAELYTTYDADYGDNRILQWETEDAVIMINGFLGKDEIVKIAESME